MSPDTIPFSLGPRLREALRSFDTDGAFSEADYACLRACLARAVSRPTERANVVDGLVGLFFERHILSDQRRTELLEMSDEPLLRAVRHRFRQVVADAHDHYQPFHALNAHVRDALVATSSGTAVFPVSVHAQGAFSAVAVEQAVMALWAEWGRKPSAVEATTELFRRYVQPELPAELSQQSRDFPEVVRSRLDAQRLARGVLDVLSVEERDLLRFVLDGEGSVEDWALMRGVSRATAYRWLSRLKTLCKVGLKERSPGTQINVLELLRESL